MRSGQRGRARGRLAARRLAARFAGLPHTEGTVDSAPARVAGDITGLWIASMRSREPLVDRSSPVDVSMASHGSRLSTAWLAVEAIGRGGMRPRRLILHVERDDVLPWRIRRQARRGLEVVRVEPGLGPHAKLYPYATSDRESSRPLILADDDIVYPDTWLADLLDASVRSPGCIVAHRCHRFAFDEQGPAPYASWPACTTTAPSFAHFGTSVCGQLVPAAVLDAIAARGDAFRTLAPSADDIWLHATAVAMGVRVAQVRGGAEHFPFVPGTQTTGLNLENVHRGANDRQIGATYTSADLEAISEAASAETADLESSD